MPSHLLGAAAAAGACLVASPYLARLTLTVPDRDRRDWWRGAPAGRDRMLVTAGVATGLGALAGAAAGWGALWPALLLCALVGTPLAIVDSEHRRLPNRLVVPLAGGAAVLIGLAAVVESDGSRALRALGGAAAVLAVLFVLTVVSPKGFGRGHVKLGAVLGAYLGWFGWGAVYVGILAGFLLGALVSVYLLGTGRASRSTPIPFGAMLIVGPLLTLAFHLVPLPAP